MDERLCWLALGVGLASRHLLAQLQAGVGDEAGVFGGTTFALPRRLWEALAAGDEAQAAALLRVAGVDVREGDTPAAAVVSQACREAQRLRQEAVAREVSAAAAALGPDQFREFMATVAARLNPPARKIG